MKTLTWHWACIECDDRGPETDQDSVAEGARNHDEANHGGRRTATTHSSAGTTHG